MLSGQAKIAGVIGWPVAHSLSPRLHHYWLECYGIDGAYVPLPVRPEDCRDVLLALPKMGFRGVNLTLPHKELVLPWLDSMDEAARQACMANTIVIGENGALHGMNTDSYGFLANIRPLLPQRRGKAVILGAGGAAKAVCQALLEVGFSHIAITNRTATRAESLARQWPQLSAEPWEKRAVLLENADLLVNATSLGMTGKQALEIDLSALSKQALVADIVYAPLETELLRRARERGNPVADGLGMLLHQAVPAFEAWFGVRPEVTKEVRAHLVPSPLVGED